MEPDIFSKHVRNSSVYLAKMQNRRRVWKSEGFRCLSFYSCQTWEVGGNSPSPLPSNSPEMEDHAVECEISIIPKLKRAKLSFKSHVNLGNPTNCRSGFEFQYTNITIFRDIFCYMILYKSRKCLKCDFRKMLPHCLNFLCSQRWL